MTQKLNHRLMLGTALAALAASATPAFAQDEPAPAADGRPSCRPAATTGDLRHRAAPRGKPAERADRGHRFLGRGARAHRARPTSPTSATPRRTSRSNIRAAPTPTLTAFIRGVGQQDPVAGFEAGVGLYLDDVYLQPAAGRGARHLRRRADRGAARAAGHALRPQHDRRRDQICHSPARRRSDASASAPMSAPTSRSI